MTRAEAVKRLERLYSKGKGYYRVLNIFTSPEQRAEALAELRELRVNKEDIDLEVKNWLEAQSFYVEKMAQRRVVVKSLQDATSIGLSHTWKFTIGRDIGYANEITGHGDTWEEAFADAEKRK